MRKYLCLICLLYPAYAWNLFSSEDTNDSFQKAELKHSARTNQTPPKCLSRKEQSKQNRFTCPKVNELYKQGMRWKTDSGWKGYQDSFSDNIRGFMGAQWKGVGIGRVICIYSSDDNNEFPIQIATTKLVQRPDYPLWDDEPNKDLLNCVSKKGNTCDCQFSFYIEKKETDIDKIISSIDKK